MNVLIILFVVAFVFINKILLNKITNYIHLLVFNKESIDEGKRKPLSISKGVKNFIEWYKKYYLKK